MLPLPRIWPHELHGDSTSRLVHTEYLMDKDAHVSNVLEATCFRRRVCMEPTALASELHGQ